MKRSLRPVLTFSQLLQFQFYSGQGSAAIFGYKVVKIWKSPICAQIDMCCLQLIFQNFIFLNAFVLNNKNLGWEIEISIIWNFCPFWITLLSTDLKTRKSFQYVWQTLQSDLYSHFWPRGCINSFFFLFDIKTNSFMEHLKYVKVMQPMGFQAACSLCTNSAYLPIQLNLPCF